MRKVHNESMQKKSEPRHQSVGYSRRGVSVREAHILRMAAAMLRQLAEITAQCVTERGRVALGRDN